MSTTFGKLIKGLMILSAFTTPLSCEDIHSFIVNCDECYEQRTEETEVLLRFTINKENPEVYFELYSGDVDNGTLIYSGSSSNSEVKFWLQTNSYYSIKVFYKSKGRNIIVIDGTTVKLKYDKSSCSTPCYTISGDKLDGRIRY
ncbi:MAG: hypothetical protein PWR03_2247 [Tenuifilum sp.]|jgi:hypothetical protein|uniref:hypothetical protein n=1 Tax=Tenuifilum sp. TaxID=2760880 RepID=UPI0024ABDAC2|nr:hypothetical protein [Tenuifilum sp.]MDI3528063.1 hypothetical protein [Tenuifilum sp.]